jgi:hypothetical protein
MVRAILISAFMSLVLVAASGCSKHCNTTNDCSEGQLCDPINRECISECKTDMDCGGGTAHCDTQYGVCRSTFGGFHDDAGLTDTGTTAMDAMTRG